MPAADFKTFSREREKKGTLQTHVASENEKQMSCRYSASRDPGIMARKDPRISTKDPEKMTEDNQVLPNLRKT